jgi:hypothetical protein
VIGKICPRGKRVGGLIRYLYATGPAQQEGRRRRNPHVDPRLVGGFDDPAELEPTVGESGRRDFRRLVALLEQPLAAAGAGVGPDKRPVYHLVIAARKDVETGAMVDRHLADEQWRDIAATYLDRIGLAPAAMTWGCAGRGPARRRPRARGGHPGPPGRPAGVPPQRLLPGRRGLPRGRGRLRVSTVT